MKKYVFIILIFSVSILEANDSKLFRLFNDYIIGIVKSEPIVNSKFYIVSIDGCGTYVNPVLRCIDKIDSLPTNSFIVLCTSNKVIPEGAKELLKRPNFLLDKQNKFFRLNISPHNNCIIQINDSSSIQIKKYNQYFECDEVRDLLL